MQEETAADDVGDSPAENYHEFAKEYEPHKPHILVPYAAVDNCLCEEREHKLQETADEEGKEDNEEYLPVFLEIAEKEAEGASFPSLINAFFPLVECLRGFKEHGDSFPRAVGLGDCPMLLKLLFCVFYEPLPRVCDMELAPLSCDLVQYDKMILVPMEYAWQHGFRQTDGGHPATDGAEAEFLRCLAYAEHGDSLSGGEAVVRECRHGVPLPIMTTEHRKACYAALHGVVLALETDVFHGRFFYFCLSGKYVKYK